MNSLFATRLRSLRTERKETQEIAAKVIDVQRGTYSSYERGIIVPPYDKIKKLATHFGVSVDYLMGQTNIMNERPKNEGDAVDVSRALNLLLDELNSSTSAVTIDGVQLDEESRSLLISSVESSVKLAQLLKRKG